MTTTPPNELPFTTGPFEPTQESLGHYECPEWFRDAKFGIWSHWGPQCVTGQGDWYARHMYIQGNPRYEYHCKTFGHPSKFGHKDIIPLWKAENWDPEGLMDLYAAAGAKYFVSMGVHHDNFDLWNSKHHRWNAVNMGPKRDVVALWREAALRRGLRFGVSEHLGASYSWFQTSHGADTTGEFAGVPYDGANPEFQDYYHPAVTPYTEHIPSLWYTQDAACQANWYARCKDLVDAYQPDLLYSDGGIPFGETGRRLIAHLYNSSLQWNGGALQAVYNYKDIGSGDYYYAGVQDVERGGIPDINPRPWQTDTTIGDWFYRVDQKYKTLQEVVQTLADVVSKNGTMLLNIVQYADGTIPDECRQFLKELAAWMETNGEAIFSTRPWKTYGEGPTKAEFGHFKEGTIYTAADVRFTQSKDWRNLYAIVLGVPTVPLQIRSLSLAAGAIESVDLLGSHAKVEWVQDGDGLRIAPQHEITSAPAIAYRIAWK